MFYVFYMFVSMCVSELIIVNRFNFSIIFMGHV